MSDEIPCTEGSLQSKAMKLKMWTLDPDSVFGKKSDLMVLLLPYIEQWLILLAIKITVVA